LLLSGAADLLGTHAHVVGAGEHLLERQPSLVQAPGAGERLDVPERARREGAFRAEPAIGALQLGKMMPVPSSSHVARPYGLADNYA
jgi:hypothetical protein